MTFLELVQRFRQETGYANTGPSTVLSQSGDHARAVSWIADAYTDIQNEALWRWMRKEFSLTTTADDGEYAYSDATYGGSAISRFRKWHLDPRNPMKCYLQSSGVGTEYWLTGISWDEFNTLYGVGTQVSSSPSFVSVDPADNLVLGPAPGDTYIVTGEFSQSAQVLAADSDTPEMPSDFHMLIVYRAMEDHGYFDAADEILSRGMKRYRNLMNNLRRTQGPKWRKAGAMA